MWFALVFMIALTAISGKADAQQRQKTLQQPHNQPNQQKAAPDTRGTESSPIIVKELPRERTQEEKDEVNKKSEFDRKLADYTSDLAFYTECLFVSTLLLAGFTGWLAFVASRQVRDSRKSVATSIRLANAAETTTRHVDRPYLFVSLADGKFGYQLAEGRDERPNSLALSSTIQNYGRTPAIIDATNFNMVILGFIIPEGGTVPVETLPVEPVYDRERNAAVHRIIGQDKSEDPEDHIFRSDDIREISAGIERNKFPFVFGFVQYSDISGRRYQRGFGFTFSNGRFNVHHRKYNYDRELEPHEGLVIPENAP